MVRNAIRLTSIVVSFRGLRNWIDLLIKDCLPNQNSTDSTKDKNTAPKLEFAQTAEGFNHRISTDTKGPIYPASGGKSDDFVIWHAFTNFVVAKHTSLNDAQTVADVLLKQ